MKLSQLAAKPQLIKITLDDEDTVKEFGEALDFYIHDRQSMDVFVRLATLDYTNFGQVASLVKELVLDEEGKTVVKDDLVLPTHILMKAITKVIEELGKSVATTTTKEIATSN